MKRLQSLKYSPPVLGVREVRRPRIYMEFDHALKNGNLFLYGKSAYGKSAAIAQWVRERNINYSWLNLDELDNNITVFCKNLAYSILAVQPECPVTPNQIENFPGTSPMDALLDFIYLQKDGKQILVLDNFQLITNKQTLHCFSLLLRRLPKKWAAVIIGRSVPPACLVFCSFSKQLILMDETLLRFHSEEIQILSDLYGISLSPGQLRKIEDITEGWILALHLLFTADTDGEGLGTNGKRRLYHFFRENSWKALPYRIRLFLLQTCLLENLPPSLCSRLSGLPDSNHYIYFAENLNIFLFSKKNGAYYYHPLYKDFLIEQMKQSGMVDYKKEFLKEAAALENTNPYRSLAFYIEGEDYEKLLELTLTYPYWILDYPLGKAEIGSLSEHGSTPFLLVFILFLIYEGNIKEGFHRMKEFESRLKQEREEGGKTFLLRQKVFYLYLFIKIKNPCYSAFQVLDLLKENQRGPLPAYPYAYALFTQSAVSLFNGALDFSSMLLNVPNYLKQFQSISAQIFGSCGKIFGTILAAEASFEKNELSQAFDSLEQAHALCLEHYEPELYFIVTCRFGILKYTLHQKKAALDILSDLADLFTGPHTARLKANWNALRIRLKIWGKDTDTALAWLRKRTSVPEAPRFYQIEEHLTTLYALYLTSDYRKALLLSEKLLILCKAYGRIRYTAELYLLKTFCMEKLSNGEDDSYLNPLYKAVLLGQKYKFVQLFTVMEKTDRLLKRLLAKASELMFTGINEAYIKNLIYAAGKTDFSGGLIASEAHHVKLSAKQREMLLYLSKGMSYKEICEAAGLKITTVRTHISNLYRKLDATNKKEALIRATELGFFSR